MTTSDSRNKFGVFYILLNHDILAMVVKCTADFLRSDLIKDPDWIAQCLKTLLMVYFFLCFLM